MERVASTREGDWQCPNSSCANHLRFVFGSKVACPLCGAPKPEAHATLKAASQEALSAFDPAKPLLAGTLIADSGDWQCPNSNCVNSRNMVFASKSHCPKCGTPKPRSNAAFSRSHGVSTGTAVPTSILGLTATPATTSAVPNAVVAAQLLQYGLPLPYLPMTSQLGVTSFPTVGSLATQTDGLPGGLSRPGDWQCPNEACVNHKRLVFAKKDQCPQCGSARPGRGGANPQDWQCPNAECQNHRNYVFAKHEMCPRCGSARDPSLGRPRSRSPLR